MTWPQKVLHGENETSGDYLASQCSSSCMFVCLCAHVNIHGCGLVLASHDQLCFLTKSCTHCKQPLPTSHIPRLVIGTTVNDEAAVQLSMLRQQLLATVNDEAAVIGNCQ